MNHLQLSYRIFVTALSLPCDSRMNRNYDNLVGILPPRPNAVARPQQAADAITLKVHGGR